MRIIALDVGERTIGVAVSDPLGWTAQGIKTIRRKSNAKDLEEIKNVIDEYVPEKIVIGLPKNMNGTEGSSVSYVKVFGERLKDFFKIDILYEDERLTTVSAQKALIEADMSRKKRKGIVDMVAATYILQTYLDRINRDWLLTIKQLKLHYNDR